MAVNEPAGHPVEEFWGEVERELRRRFGGRAEGDAPIDRWLGMVRPRASSAGEVELAVPNRFVLDWFERRYRESLEEILRERFGTPLRVSLRVDPELFPELGRSRDSALRRHVEATGAGPVLATEAAAVAPSSDGRPPRKMAARAESPGRDLHGTAPSGRRRLDSFLVGDSNRSAARAVKGAVEHVLSAGTRETSCTERNPYNPIFVVGPTGVGKTHLVRAAHDEVRASRRDLESGYYSFERFLNTFVHSLKSGEVTRFRERVRGLHLLVVDDFHQLANKRKTQEEFLHTFDALINSGAQIVLAGTRHPKSLDGVDESLMSRLRGGLTVTVSKPDYATRLEILRARAKTWSRAFSDQTLAILAELVPGNARELIGAFNQLTAHVEHGGLSAVNPDRDRIAEIVSEVFEEERIRVTADGVLKRVSEFYRVSIEEIRSSRRDRTVTRARHVAIALCRSYTDHSYSEIAARFSRNASTVRASVRRVDTLERDDHALRRELAALRELIEQSTRS